MSGLYYFGGAVNIENISGSHTSGRFKINNQTTAQTFDCFTGSLAAMKDSSNQYGVMRTAPILCTAGDVINLSLTVNGGTKTVGAGVGAIPALDTETYFYGWLVG